MIELKITGNTFAEINEQVLDVVKGIGQAAYKEAAAVAFPDSTATHTVDIGATMTKPFISGPNHLRASDEQAAEEKKKRRSKAEIEADKQAKLDAAKAEVKAAEASHAPIAAPVIPPMPTTQHVVSIPQSEEPKAAPTIAPPAPVQTEAPKTFSGYNLQSFKTNLVMIINGLLVEGKITSQWIGETAKEHFAGKDIWLWAQDEKNIGELFKSLVAWNFIQEFKG